MKVFLGVSVGVCSFLALEVSDSYMSCGLDQGCNRKFLHGFDVFWFNKDPKHTKTETQVVKPNKKPPSSRLSPPAMPSLSAPVVRPASPNRRKLQLSDN